ncbi:MAG TPA: type II toxin-antitoxin system HicA family toxin [Geminicoccaceae bacterium]|nr:type II toxin-antitoxin system HicA family toxin [Geminicoccaceae bacterium]
MYDDAGVTGNELLRRLRRLARRRGVPFRHVAGRGKGSHGRIYFGDRLTTLQDPRRELPKGTLRGMLDDLGIDFKDLS